MISNCLNYKISNYIIIEIYFYFKKTQVLDANCEYREMTELYETRREEILCGYV
jgi:hypothetical protein